MDGLGVMIRSLGGNEDTVRTHQGAIGKTILRIWMQDECLNLSFTDGSGIVFCDEGQSCCESRYMRTDDNLSEFSGATFIGGEIRPSEDAPKGPDDYGEHEIQFLVVKTDRGNITMSSHNEHNGYYGGFWITVQPLGQGSPEGAPPQADK